MSDQTKMAGKKDYRSWITADGSSGFKAEKGRYHLYVGYGCPFAHRAIITRHLKGLTDIISMSVVSPTNTDLGWTFDVNEEPECTVDHLFGKTYLRELYKKGDENFCGTITVPMLFDKQQGIPVNNESAEILRMFNREFNHLIKDEKKAALDLVPKEKEAEINAMNELVGKVRSLYYAGFAKKQEDYDKNVKIVFETLDEIENILAKKKYLHGENITESDIHHYVTLARFDVAYYFVYKCNLKKIADYPNTYNYLKDLFHQPGFGNTTKWRHIKKIYFTSNKTERQPPASIVPIGPNMDYSTPHNRESIGRTDFRYWVTADGSTGFKAEKGRYHLYVSLGCPFAHRAVIARAVKGLEKIISMSVCSPTNTDNGWKFDPKGLKGNTEDHLYGKTYLKELYQMGDPNFKGRITVPLLFDKIKKVPVNNESAEIVRMFDKEFNHLIDQPEKAAVQLLPYGRTAEIDAMNERLGKARSSIYGAGFAKDQATYEKGIEAASQAMEDLEKLLANRRYLNGSTITESDIHHYVTLIRLDTAMRGKLRYHVKAVEDLPNTLNYLRDLYQTPGFGETTDFDHIKHIYFTSEKTGLPPTPSITPVGPTIDFGDHNRTNMN